MNSYRIGCSIKRFFEDFYYFDNTNSKYYLTKKYESNEFSKLENQTFNQLKRKELMKFVAVLVEYY